MQLDGTSCCPFWGFHFIKKKKASRAGRYKAWWPSSPPGWHVPRAREATLMSREQRQKSRAGGGAVWLCGSFVRCSLNSSPAPAQPPRGRFLKYGDKLPAQYLAENRQLYVLLPLSVLVTVWIDSVDFWCSGVHLASGRRWRWHCSCAVRFSCASLIYQCTCVVLYLFWLLSTVAWCLSSLLRGVPLLRLVPWTAPSALAAALVSPSTSHRAGPDVGSGIGFLGQNLVFPELVFWHRQSTCCELPVVSLYLLSNFVRFASNFTWVWLCHTQFLEGNRMRTMYVPGSELTYTTIT
jgi:hypothetical protein